MFSSIPFKRPQPGARARRRAFRVVSPERLESRELLTGFANSIPNLVVQGFPTPLATWGGPFSASISVSNTASNTTLQPLSLQPGESSPADAGQFTVAVSLISKAGGRTHAVQLGSVPFSGLAQNSSETLTANFVLPNRPLHFPSFGGKTYLQLVVNPSRSLVQPGAAANVFVDRQDPVKIVTPAAAVRVVGVDLPATMQPGDTIAPNIRLANVGAINSAVGGPLTVELVASTSKFFTAGVSVVAKYTVDQIQPQSLVPTQSLTFGDVNLDPQLNEETLFGSPVTLPVRPKTYYLGVVVNPDVQATALAQVGKILLLGKVTKVGPPIRNLPPAGVVGQPITPAPNPFPFPNAPVLNNP